ncbi:MAG: hypothetical protein Q9181_006352 [Wetmoreana brouardii]
MYRGAADKWPIRHTPPEVKAKRNAELQSQEELQETASDDSSDNDNNGNGVGARVGLEKAVAALYQADWLPTPPLSTESPLATTHRRKRWRIPEEDDENIECPTKTRVSSAKRISAAEDTVPSTLQCNGRKRRLTLDVGDKKESKERAAKIRITTTNPSSRRLRKLRTRRPAG